VTPTAWQRLPVVVRAVLSGFALSAAGTLPWAAFAYLNLNYLPAVPWALVPSAAYLWLFWRYARGEGWPRSTAQARRALLRANPLGPEVWSAALVAGILGLWGIVLGISVYGRLVALPHQPPPDLSRVSGATILFLLVMGAVVAGVVEEAAFRGYMQGPIERRHGPVAAILVTGLVFALAHFTHREVTLVLVPYYVAVALVYGAIAFLTDSILPSLALHAFGNVLSGIQLLLGGGARSVDGLSTAPGLVWETGADLSFWLSCLALAVVAGASIWAYAVLGRVARAAANSEPARSGPLGGIE
jgi:membrane protease YdiL (CAAX protease family)